jgi:hypothetical protein
MALPPFAGRRANLRHPALEPQQDAGDLGIFVAVLGQWRESDHVGFGPPLDVAVGGPGGAGGVMPKLDLKVLLEGIILYLNHLGGLAVVEHYDIPGLQVLGTNCWYTADTLEYHGALFQGIGRRYII